MGLLFDIKSNSESTKRLKLPKLTDLEVNDVIGTHCQVAVLLKYIWVDRDGQSLEFRSSKLYFVVRFGGRNTGLRCGINFIRFRLLI